MARLRKAARIWRNPAARDAARRVTVAGDDRVFAIDLAALFKRAAPLEVELGAGLGDFVIERAGVAPERNFIAVDLAGSVARMLAVRIGRVDLPNVKVIRADARTLVNLLMPDLSVAAYHIYFPDPWPRSATPSIECSRPASWRVSGARSSRAGASTSRLMCGRGPTRCSR